MVAAAAEVNALSDEELASGLDAARGGAASGGERRSDVVLRWAGEVRSELQGQALLGLGGHLMGSDAAAKQ